jgi:dipeptidyl aminopeptidase/acylaminoacyl peptidase
MSAAFPPIVMAALVAGLGSQAAAAEPARRAVVNADSIELREFSSVLESTISGGQDDTIAVSPDGTLSAAIVRAGNLRTNKVDYSILLVRSPAKAAQLPAAPRELVRVSSSSNFAAIQGLRWSKNGKFLVFSGDAGGGHRRVFKVDVASGRLTKLTPDNVDVANYDVTGDLRGLVYLPVGRRPDMSSVAGQSGLVIDRISYWDMIGAASGKPDKLVIVRDGRSRSYPLPFGLPSAGAPRVQFSPSGSSLLISETPTSEQVPAHWKRHANGNKDAVFPNYWVVDARSGSGHRLLDAHCASWLQPLWTSDRTVLLPASYVPFGNGDEAEQKADMSAVEIDVDSGNYKKLADGKFRVRDWNEARQIVSLTPAGRGEQPAKSYRKSARGWEEVATDATSFSGRVIVDQALNRPPQLAWLDSLGTRTPFYDPNPQLQKIDLGDARAIDIPLRDGKTLKASLFLPAGWSIEKHYPALLQTYSQSADKFTMDGREKMTPGHSARTLAARGILVVQLAPADTAYPSIITTAAEGPVGMQVYEDVVAELSRSYGVDTDRVGIQGFSRSGIDVRYALANSRQKYAASALLDSFFVGYETFLMGENANGQNTMRNIVGAEPFGDGMQSWIRNAAVFSLQRVTAPQLNLHFGPSGGVALWEEFVALRHLKKPAEFVYFPDALHNPVKPAERLAVKDRFVDWFCFWLQGYEDPDPAKAEQYRRWHGLRDLQNAPAP